MSKERLERLKAKRVWKSADGAMFHTVDKEDYEWLIRQLEKFVEESHSLVFEVNELEKEKKRFREALKFYADERNYEDIGIPTGNNPPALPILEDRGQVARKELEGEE